jgi:hypothetical protein
LTSLAFQEVHINFSTDNTTPPRQKKKLQKNVQKIVTINSEKTATNNCSGDCWLKTKADDGDGREENMRRKKKLTKQILVNMRSRL